MSTYWQKRAVNQLYGAMEDAEKVANKIATVYAKASLWLNQEAESIFNRFKTKWGLTDEEAYRLISEAGTKATADQLLQTYQAAGGGDKSLIREIESQAFRIRLQHLADISAQLDAVMQNVYRQELQQSTALYKELAGDQYYKTIFSLQQRAGCGFSFAHVSEKQIDRMLQMKWYGKNYSERIWGNTRELADELSKEMLVSLVTGRTDRETAEIISQKFGVGAIKSRRLVRTEAAWVSSQMVLAGYQEAGIKKYMFLATLDLRTSQLCRSHDGMIYPVEKYEIGKTAPPLHPWCRSTTVAVVNREWMKNHTRGARDSAGKYIKVPLTMTYDEWYRKYIKGNTVGEAEEKKVKNKAADRKQYEEYRKILGDNIPDSFVKFQDMKYNDAEKWEYTKALKEYLQKYPDSDNRYFNIQYDLKKSGIQQGIVLPPKPKQAYILPEGKREPYHIMRRMLERNITDDELRGYMSEAKCMFVQWGGQRQVFYGANGVAVVAKTNDSWVYKTAWKKSDFDETTDKIMEVINKYVR